jgi:hypothetical protein
MVYYRQGLCLICHMTIYPVNHMTRTRTLMTCCIWHYDAFDIVCSLPLNRLFLSDVNLLGSFLARFACVAAGCYTYSVYLPGTKLLMLPSRWPT